MKIFSVLIASIVFVLPSIRSAQQPDAAQTLVEADKLHTEITKLYFQNKYDEAIPLAKRHLSLRESALPRDHAQVASAASLLAQLYLFNKKYREAEPLLLRAIQINETAREQADPLVIADLEKYTCLLFYFDKQDKVKEFEERRISLLKQSSEHDRFWGSLHRITQAITMPRPKYPPEGIAAGAQGPVLIKVHIDELGQVTKAVSMCGGHPSLLAAAEEGARRSRFNAVLTADGKPMRVIGYLWYRFINRSN